jgi:hypothetical protein
MMERCSNAKRYGAAQPPRCNGGHGCKACWARWAMAHPDDPKAAKWRKAHMAWGGSGATAAITDLAEENLGDIRRLRNENERLRGEVAKAAGLATPEPKKIARRAEPKADAIPCVVASDWHVEETVRPETVNGLNEFNPDIARRRAELFFQRSLTLVNGVARDSKIDTIHLSLLGDFFSGYIHPELQETNALGPIDAADFAAELLTSGIEFWLRNSSYRIIGDALPGNHGRLTLKMRHANVVGTSLESFAYRKALARFDGNPRVDIKLAAGGRTYRDLFPTFKMRLFHGYEVGFQGGIGGVTIPLRKKIAAWDRSIRAQLSVCGHFHQLLNGGDFVVNGSLIGYSAYAEAIAASPEPPRQSFFLVHARHGGQMALSAPIWLD